MQVLIGTHGTVFTKHHITSHHMEKTEAGLKGLYV